VGAEVNWIYPYSGLREVNVLGTRALLRLACRAGNASLTFVSTTSLCTSTAGPNRPVSEADDMFPYLEGIPFGYPQSKCVAEHLVLTARSRGLAATVVRPSFIVGDSETGSSNLSDFVSLFFKGCIELGYAPDLDWELDACPVDFVGRAIVRLSCDEAIVHLKTQRPFHLRECALWLNLYGYQVTLIEFAEWLDRLAQAPATNALRGLRPFFEQTVGPRPLVELYECSGKQPLDDELSRQRLETAGMTRPTIKPALLERYFASFIGEGFLPAPDRRSGHETSSQTDRSIVGRVGRALGRDDLRLVGPCHGDSIINELTSWRDPATAGLFRLRLADTDETVVAKAKASDDTVVEVATRVARLCSARVGAAFEQHRDALGVDSSRKREPAVYSQQDDRFVRHVPKVLAVDDGLMVLEDISGMRLLDAASDQGWAHRDVVTALSGLAELHAVWLGREEELARRDWLGTTRSTSRMVAATELWQALAEYSAPLLSTLAGAPMIELQRRLVDSVGDWWPELEKAPRTLIHNDFTSRNVALRATAEGDRLCAFDWELATLGAPLLDVVELFCFVLPRRPSREQLADYVTVHRRALEHASGRPIDPRAWQRTFRFALYDRMVTRLPLYALVHRFRPQAFLERVVDTWFGLYQLHPNDI